MATVDLVNIIEQAAYQVWGSDEREMLFSWLSRNTDRPQSIKLDLRSAMIQTGQHIVVKRTRNPFADELELGWALLDLESETVAAYFYDEARACIAADALNKTKSIPLLTARVA